eukprot:gnl/Carplike_NY0171/2942_a3960_804.p1 GENE.gnl/Carplike_NY0171/2942_a3960_804~~gnl/Carplike_NY0171/2942_a3960_804.p1  ORF type:complete len:228 (-),score=37.46 gnl/Carplike_NY0171/2942_a3960_804:47-652(-)
MAVTYGSVVQLENQQTKEKLHSSPINYASGSKRQVVTTFNLEDDSNNSWLILPSESSFGYGRPVACGDTIFMKHTGTDTYLTAESFYLSPLSQQTEVSASNEFIPTGSVWRVICGKEDVKRKENVWHSERFIKFQNISTLTFLTSSEGKYNRPIAGHREVVVALGGRRGKELVSVWKTKEGMFYSPATRLSTGREGEKMDL